MRQVMIHKFGSRDVMRVEDVPAPSAAGGEILIDVHYAGLNPLDYKMRDGSSGLAAKMQLPCSLGREFVGTVTSGPQTLLYQHGLKEGDRVFGMRPHSDLRGTYAEQITIDPSCVAPVPEEVDDADLPFFGGLALVGLTAIQTIRDAQVAQGDVVLIHGGAGGVGQLLIQMALQAGAERVFATGRAANASRIKELGAIAIPYDGVNWREAINEHTDDRGVDVVIDTHYFKTFLPSLDHLVDGGRIVALPTLADLTPAKERGFHAATPTIAPDRMLLDKLAEGFADGRLQLEVSEVLPLGDVAYGHQQLESGHTRGKLILDVRA